MIRLIGPDRKSQIEAQIDVRTARTKPLEHVIVRWQWIRRYGAGIVVAVLVAAAIVALIAWPVIGQH